MQRKITKAERRLIAVSVGAIALLGGVALFRVSINATPQVVIPPYPTAPSPNGFDVYLQAAKMIVTANTAVDPINDSNQPTDEKTRAQKYSLQNKERWLKQNAAGFATFRKALKMQSLAPAFSADSEFPAYAKLRELARSKYIESSTRAMRGDWKGAMQSRIDVVQMGNDTSRNGVLIGAVVSFAIEAIGRKDVWLEIEKLDATQAREAAKRLEEMYARRVSLAEIMRAEKVFGQLDTLKQMRDPQWRSPAKWAADNLILDEDLTWQDRWRIATVSKQAVMDNYSEMLDVVIANAQLPYAAPQKPIPVANSPFTRDSVVTMNVPWIFARNDATNAMWLVALALHAYKLEHGAYSTTLRVLEGTYLKAIPADPFGGGESLRYKRVGESYKLWSVGPDMRDNRGAAISHEKNDSQEQRKKPARVQPDSKGDYVWGKNQ